MEQKSENNSKGLGSLSYIVTIRVQLLKTASSSAKFSSTGTQSHLFVSLWLAFA